SRGHARRVRRRRLPRVRCRHRGGAGRAAQGGRGGRKGARRQAHRGDGLPARRVAERRQGSSGGDMVTSDAAKAAPTARAVAETVTDPELPMLTLADLGVLREVTESADGVTVSITPTYTGCPAMDTMRDDLVHALRRAGYERVDVRTVLHPPWTTDWITERGRAKLAEAG